MSRRFQKSPCLANYWRDGASRQVRCARVARSYVQRARAESAAATQRRMIEAARSVLNSGEVPSLELAEVAAKAGIARSTVYLSFGTRSALMSLVMDDSLSRA